MSEPAIEPLPDTEHGSLLPGMTVYVRVSSTNGLMEWDGTGWRPASDETKSQFRTYQETPTGMS